MKTMQAPETSSDLLQKRQRTESIIRKVNNLYANPKVIEEVVKLLDDLSTTPHRLANMINKDQSILLKILTVANSSRFGLTNKVSSIEFAIMVIDSYAEIRNHISSLSLMSVENENDKYFDQKAFWMHSYLVATIAKKLAMDLGLEKFGEAFIAGLFHDLGISIIHRFMYSDFVKIHELVVNGLTHNEAEIQVLGMTHTEMCEILLESRNIPELIVDIIKHYQQPEMSQRAPTLASVVHLAHYMAQELKIGEEFHSGPLLKLDNFVLSKLGLKDLTGVSHFIRGYRKPLKSIYESVKLFYV